MILKPDEDYVSYELGKLLKKHDYEERTRSAFGTTYLNTRDIDTAEVRSIYSDREEDIPTGHNCSYSVITAYYYKNNPFQPHMVARPTLAEAKKWLWMKHKLYVQVEIDCTSTPKFAYSIYYYSSELGVINAMEGRQYSDLYQKEEEALNEGMIHALTYSI